MQENPDFEIIVARLKQALGVRTDTQLAQALSIKQPTWAKQKSRGALPVQEIEAVLERESINPEYIWHGTGAMHAGDEGSWADGFAQRVARSLSLETYRGVLISQGHKEKDLLAAAKGVKAPSVELLRDIHRYLSVDLNWLFSDEPGISAQEQAFLQNYRRCSDDGKRLLEHAASFAASTRQ